MWIIQDPNKVELWNRRHFEEKKHRDYAACLKYSVRLLRSPYNRPRRAQRGSSGIALLMPYLGAWRGWVFSTTPFYPRERRVTHCTGGWVGPRAGLDVWEKSQYDYLLNKYLKCSVWRLAVRYDIYIYIQYIYIYMSLGGKGLILPVWLL
jgi:hypothetical protein